MSDSHKGKSTWNKGKSGYLSRKSLRKMPEASKGRPCPWKGKTHEEFFGKEKAEKMRKINSEKRKKGQVWNKGLKKETDDRVKRNAESIRKTHNRRGKTCEEFYGEERAKEIKEKVRKGLKQKYKNDPEYRERVIKKILKGLMKRPTSFEKQLINIIEKNKLDYKYIGDGSLLIGFKNPDFINNNGQKIVVEVYHPFFKKRHFGTCQKYEKQRETHFSKFGFKTVFFKGEDLKDEKEVVRQLRKAEKIQGRMKQW